MTRPAAVLVAVLVLLGAWGAVPPRAAAAATFSDIATSPHRADIEWLAAAGITSGCGTGRFCPGMPVTREQMASFLVRFLALPTDGQPDRFDDDDASAHEADINALAASGITAGCGAALFCPRSPVTREQMASFLVRALGLRMGGANDFFVDDDRSAHAADLDRLMAAGITTGCAAGRVCPTAAVTREQMASFLRRAHGTRSAVGITLDTVEPGSIRFAVGLYAGYLFSADFSAVASTRHEVIAEPLTVATNRAMRRDGQWYHLVAGGPWDGYWIPTAAGGALPLRDGAGLPRCAYASQTTRHAGYDDWSRTLLDLTLMVSAGYVPPDLVPVTDAGVVTGRWGVSKVRGLVVADLRALNAAAMEAGFARLQVNTAFRSYGLQSEWWESYRADGGGLTYPTTLPPGHSEHQLGTTVDIDVYRSAGLNAWMNANAWRHGFVKSFPGSRNSKHCVGSEDWHYRYVGRENARRIMLSGLSPREWLWYVHYAS